MSTTFRRGARLFAETEWAALSLAKDEPSATTEQTIICPVTINDEIDRAARFAEKLDALVVAKGQCVLNGNRDMLLIAYWSLIFEYHHGILLLFTNQCPGAAFALVRTVIETLLRAHLALAGSDNDVKRLVDDDYSVNFKELGGQLDEPFALEGLFDNMLTDEARKALHSFTHSGALQIERRFKGNNLLPNYADDEIREIIRSTTTAVFMVTCLATKHFGFEDEWKKTNELYNGYCKPI
jgi:hypothetical protein